MHACVYLRVLYVYGRQGGGGGDRRENVMQVETVSDCVKAQTNNKMGERGGQGEGIGNTNCFLLALVKSAV